MDLIADAQVVVFLVRLKLLYPFRWPVEIGFEDILSQLKALSKKFSLAVFCPNWLRDVVLLLAQVMIWYWLLYGLYLVLLEQSRDFDFYLVVNRSFFKCFAEPWHFFVKFIILIFHCFEWLDFGHFNMQVHQGVTPLAFTLAYFCLRLIDGWDRFAHHLVYAVVHFLWSQLQPLPSVGLTHTTISDGHFLLLVLLSYHFLIFAKGL